MEKIPEQNSRWGDDWEGAWENFLGGGIVPTGGVGHTGLSSVKTVQLWLVLFINVCILWETIKTIIIIMWGVCVGEGTDDTHGRILITVVGWWMGTWRFTILLYFVHAWHFPHQRSFKKTTALVPSLLLNSCCVSGKISTFLKLILSISKREIMVSA